MEGDDADFFDEPVASDNDSYPSFSRNPVKNKTDSDDDKNSKTPSQSGSRRSRQQSPETRRARTNTYSSDDGSPRSKNGDNRQSKSNRSRSRSSGSSRSPDGRARNRFFNDSRSSGDDHGPQKDLSGSRNSSVKNDQSNGVKSGAQRSRGRRGSNSSGSRYNSDSDEPIHVKDSPRSKSSLKIEARVPSVASSKRNQRNSLSGSDLSSDGSRENSPLRNDKHSNSSQNRPKTSASKRDRKYSDSFSETETLSDVDSDVTDVSPLNSPHRNQNGKSVSGKPPKSPGYGAADRHSSSYYKANGSSSANVSDLIDSHSDNDKMNLNILMQAVMEMENRQNPDYEKRERIAQARRVLFVPERASPHNRKNFSFSNDKTVTIDKENQRLMQQIMKYTTGAAKSKKKQTKTTRPVQARMTPSAVNRLREQQRIERENMAFLKRLQKTSASKTIKRDNLLNDYERKTIAGHSVAAAHAHLDYSSSSMSMLQKKSFSNSSYVDAEIATVNLQGRGKWPRPSSAPTYKSAGVSDPATVTLQTKRTRPTSASTYKGPPDQRSVAEGKRRPQSAHVGSSAPTHKLVSQYRYKSDKPDWDSRW